MLQVCLCHYGLVASIILVIGSSSSCSDAPLLVSSFAPPGISLPPSSSSRSSNNNSHSATHKSRRSRTIITAITRHRTRRVITVDRTVTTLPIASSSSSVLFSSSPSIEETATAAATAAGASSATSLWARLLQKRPEPTALSIAEITDEIVALEQQQQPSSTRHTTNTTLRRDLIRAVQLFGLHRIRSWQLDTLLRHDADAYIATASFLGARIPRHALPNVQQIPYPHTTTTTTTTAGEAVEAADTTHQDTARAETVYDADGLELVPDCTMPETPVQENWAEALLLYVTRNIYANITGTTRRTDLPGIPGLVEEMRTYMLSPQGSNPQQQQQDLLQTLLVLMTPILPPFYRLFMGWKVPSVEANDPVWLVDLVETKIANNTWITKITGLSFEAGTNYGPAPYAPLLTSWVAPYVFSFLVGPVNYNLRDDGSWGGIVVEKCKFLQQSNCKGMCLHSCKAPAQELFDSLGLPLRVSPNFDTQECQWNFGEVAPEPQNDPTWPKGCLVGCGTRETVAEMRRTNNGTMADVANCY